MVLTWCHYGYGTHVLTVDDGEGSVRRKGFSNQADLLDYVRSLADDRVHWAPPVRVSAEENLKTRTDLDKLLEELPT